MTTREKTVQEIARVLLMAASRQTRADILNSLLCLEANADLTDAEVETGRWLFDLLCDGDPESITVAQHS